jgi:hypothetical protein
MTQAERDAISSPATGLLIYQTDNTPGFYYWNGTAWIPLLSSSSGSGLFWSLTGNSITGTEFLGTTNAQPLVIRTNNTERMRVTASGDVGIGTTTPLEAVEVVREGVSPAYVSTSYANANFAGAFVGRRARGTMSAPAAVQSGDALVFVGARGYDGTAFTSASRAFIRMDASENWTATAQGARIVFATTANGTTSTAERVVIQSSGDVEVKGGNVLLQNSDNTARQLRLYEPSGAGTNFTAFQAQAQASDIIYTLPASLTPTSTVGAGILQTDASGNLSWLTPSALVTGSAWTLTGNSGTNPAVNFLGTTDAQPLVIRTNNTERVRVTETGNVGIGTTAPGAKLQVHGGPGTFIRVSGAMPAGDATHGLVGYELTNSSAGDTWRIYLADPDGGFGVTPRAFEIWEYPANLGSGLCCRPRLRIMSSDGLANPTEVVINSAGNVGIGTASPGGKLHISGGYGGLPNDWSAGGNSLVIGSKGSSPDAVSFAFGDNTGWKLHFGTPVSGVFTPRVTIVDVGNVGIGTTSPSERLQVSDGNVAITNTDNTARQLRLYEPSGAGTNFTAFRAQAQASDIIYTLPASLTPTGTVGAGILQTDASGNLSWLSPAALVTGSAWALTGNSGTNPAVNFLGTTDAQPLVIRTNNTERMRVTATGNVGIGTAAPTERLQVSDGNVAITNTDNTARQLRLYEPSGAGTNFTAFQAQAQASDIIYTLPASLTPTSTVGAGILQTDASGNLSWLSPTALVTGSAWALTGNSGTNPAVNFLGTTDAQPLVIRTNNTERMRITATGNVGIGTAAPALRLAIVDAGVGLDRPAANVLALYTNNTERVRITATGNVGIGTAAPTERLQVSDGNVAITNTDNTARQLRLYEPSGAGTNFTAFQAQAQASDIIYTLPASLTPTSTVGAGILQTDASGNLSWLNPTALVTGSAWALTGNSGTNPAVNFLGTTDAQPLVIRTNNTERMRITATGNVGIGTAAPALRLAIVDAGVGLDRPAANVLALYTNNTERVRITATGNVGIGTAAPTERLQVSDGNIAITNTDNTARQLRLYEPSGAGTNFTAFQAQAQASDIIYTLPASLTPTSAVGAGILQTDASGNLSWLNPTALVTGSAWALTGNSGTNPAVNFLGTTDAQPLVIRTNNTERMRVTATGNVGIGTAAPALRLAIVDAGVGLDRPAANVLALYTNNTERVRVTATGNVGIGTAAPTERLQVSDGNVAITNTDGTARQLRLYEPSGAGANFTAFQAQAQASDIIYTLPASLTPTSTVGAGILQTDASGNLSWLSPAALVTGSAWALTGNSGTNPAVNFLGTTDAQPLVIRTNNTERMRITATGNVGIGTAAPALRLAIVDAGVGLDRPAANVLALYTNNTERVRITATGNVGIGTAAPTERLQVSDGNVAITNTDNTARQLRLYEPSGAGTNFTAFQAQAQASDIIYTLPASLTPTSTVGAGILQTDASGNLSWLSPAALVTGSAWALTGNSGTNPAVNFLGTTDAQPLVIRTNNTERMRVTATGNVGIGTAAPALRLAIVDAGVGLDRPAANVLALYTNNTERVRITATGNVGIGTAAPTERLQVSDGNVAITNTDNTARQLRLYEPSGAGTNFTAFQAQAQASDIIYTLPASLTPTSAVGAGILQTDASGNLSWLNPAALVTGSAWALTGNSGTNPAVNFLGTTDAQPLVIRVGNQETFRFNPPGTTAPAWSIQRGGGDPRGLHAVDLQSARSAPTQVASGDYSVIGGGVDNTASGGYATVGGGLQNTASGKYATVGGGGGNTASGGGATVSGGEHNTASGDYATVGGGDHNTASGLVATVGGGGWNTASGQYATVGGGFQNTASGDYSAIPGGYNLRVGTRSFGFSGQTTTTQTDLSANSNIAAFVDVDLWLYSRDRTQASQLRFYEAQAHGSGANYVALRAPTSLSANTTYTLPASAPATSAAWLQSDNTGAMSWRPVLYGTVTVDPPNIAANSSGTVAVTITGVQTGDLVFLTPPSGIEAALIFQGASVTGANTVTIQIRNVSGAAVDGAARTWSYMVIRP